MNRHHRSAKFRGFHGRMLHGVWYVVEFQVQENFRAKIHNLANDRRPRGHEQLAADFEHSGHVPEGLHKRQGLLPGTDVQRNDDFLFHCFI